MQDKGNAPLTIKGYITGVKSFYSAFEIELPKLTKAGNKAQTLKKHKDIPTKEDLQEVLKVCDPMEKAIILIGVSSGLSANEIINLKVGDFKKGYNPDTGITTLDLRRGKVDFDFITFLSPECSNAVNDYINYRARTTKINETRRLNQLEKQRVFLDTDHLFIKRKIDPEYLKTHDDNLRKHDEDSFMKVYRFISDKARKNTPKGDWNLIRSHNMRKYFNSTLLNAGADSFHVEFFMGHTLDDTKAAYFRASPEKLRDIYLKYVPYLTIQKDLDLSESEDFQRIKKEHETLLIEAEKNRVERSELKELKAEIERLKQESEREKAIEKEFAAGLNAFWQRNTEEEEQLYDQWEQHMKDSEYAKKFNEYKKYWRGTTAGMKEHKKDIEEYKQNKEKEKEKLDTAKDKIITTMSKFFED